MSKAGHAKKNLLVAGIRRKECSQILATVRLSFKGGFLCLSSNLFSFFDLKNGPSIVLRYWRPSTQGIGGQSQKLLWPIQVLAMQDFAASMLFVYDDASSTIVEDAG